ncbi:MAG: DMT family transporter [Pseudomonadota bacterium]
MGARHRLLGCGCALLAAVLISVSNVWSGQYYRDGGNGESLLLLRYLAFVPLVLVVMRLRGTRLGLPRADRAVVWTTGACYAVGGGALVLAFGRLPVSLVVLVLYAFPFVTLVAESVMSQQWPAVRQCALMGLAFVGLVLALGGDLALHDPLGLLFAVLAALGVGLSFALTGRYLTHLDSALLACHMAVVALLLATALVVFTGRFALPASSAALVTLVTVIAAFSVAYVAMFAAVQRAGASVAATLMNLEPVVTLWLAAWVLSETFSGGQWLGAALVVVAVVAYPVWGVRRAA